MRETLENKYIDLLINRCISFKNGNSLFIRYPSDLEEFIAKLVTVVKKKGIDDVHLECQNVYERHEKLQRLSEKEIENDSYFNDAIWDEYAKKNAAFLMISSIFPHLNDDIDSKKLAVVSKLSMTTKPIYREKQKNGDISWCIAVMPNKVWAKDKFPDLSEEDAYDKLFELMMDATMVSKENPIDEWNKFLDSQRKITKKLNDLEITKMHYTNDLGTDLEIELSTESLWNCAGYDNDDIIVNMPTYEVFTSPNKNKTNGIVYAARPLTYNGITITDFWIKFKDGKVIDYDAKNGKEILKSIIESDENSCFLGEVALVSKNSAIAKTDFVFDETCLDENASCHLALGEGFPDCIKDGLKKSDKELENIGLNFSKNHVDFMIGTKDLNIWAETKEGTKQIFKDGDFNIM